MTDRDMTKRQQDRKCPEETSQPSVAHRLF